MAVSNSDLVAGWKEVLTLCNLRVGEQVTILTSDDSHPQVVATCQIACSQMGAILTLLALAPMNGEKALSRDKSGFVGKTALETNRVALAALKSSDLIIDTMMLLFSPEQEQILKTGARMLLAVEPPEILLRLLPTRADKLRALAATACLKQARRMTVVSDAGTDFHCELGEYPVLTQHGFSDLPGKWDHWPSCFVATWPNEKTSQGRIVMDTGDIILPFKRYLRSPVTLTIEEGYIRRIDGGYDAEFMREFIDSFNDPQAYAMAHVGWGLMTRAHWTTLGLYDKEATIGMDARAFAGNFLFSSGPNTEAGGLRDTPCHLDIPLRNCSLSLDGVAMTQRGKVMADDQR
ncbi:2,5-dihydroxypyridine 5,6-dioxygenase [Acerihabitans sp. TG2]|uniref:2,5-dihydroxypyridine 5,6-dioxygenase n=1 Tax=Acerihabitans sp. TG2 TaxID=3096008 RepID=UPI002B227F20|nr:2,5-dihydroxypyridine 5,6-dioxygenase [Acerihabitans sp. TG2]MEA9391256.1 2,5-dihydroxypyridine 5,6-dioxygenase [Acerihabitans sp. TG2]